MGKNRELCSVSVYMYYDTSYLRLYAALLTSLSLEKVPNQIFRYLDSSSPLKTLCHNPVSYLNAQMSGMNMHVRGEYLRRTHFIRQCQFIPTC